MNLIEQEMSTERWIEIPQEIQAILKLIESLGENGRVRLSELAEIVGLSIP